jgi:glycine cleavage system aminomethyltransferase T
MVGADDLDRAARFYDAILVPLGLVQVERAETYAAYAPEAAKDAIELYVTTPFDQRPATPGNGTMIALVAPSMQALEQFHTVGLQNGGTDEGAPGPREEGSAICYAYVRDFDGNKICAFHDRAKDQAALVSNRIFPTYVGSNELSPFHHCYANDQTVLRLAVGRFFAHHNGDDPVAGYWALRKHAALFDVPERPVEISGPDAVALLERIFARRIAEMAIDRGRYALACTHQGGIFMDGILFRLAEDKFWFVHPDGDLDTWLLAHNDSFDVTVSDPKSRVLQIQGPNSYQILHDASSGAITEDLKYFHSGFFDLGGQRVYVSRTGWTGELGYEIYTLGDQTDCPRLWDFLIAKGEPLGMVFSSMQSMNTRRIEAGILDSGSDFDTSMTPFEAGLERFVDLDKEGFIGRDALKAATPGTRLYGLRCVGTTPSGGDVILDDATVVGKVTTGAQSPYLECGIGYVRFDRPGNWLGRHLTLRSARYGDANCDIVELPFYDTDKHLPRGLPLNYDTA